MAQYGCFCIFFISQKLQLFQQLQPEVENFIFLTFSIFWKSPYFAQNQWLLYGWIFVQIRYSQAYLKVLDSYVLLLLKNNYFLQAFVPFKGAWNIFFENSIFSYSEPKMIKIIPKIRISRTNGICETSEKYFCI